MRFIGLNIEVDEVPPCNAIGRFPCAVFSRCAACLLATTKPICPIQRQDTIHTIPSMNAAPSLPDPNPDILSRLLRFAIPELGTHFFPNTAIRPALQVLQSVAADVRSGDPLPVKVAQLGLPPVILPTSDLSLKEAVALLKVHEMLLVENNPTATTTRFLLDGLAKLLAYTELHHERPYEAPRNIALVIVKAWSHSGVALLNDVFEMLGSDMKRDLAIKRSRAFAKAHGLMCVQEPEKVDKPFNWISLPQVEQVVVQTRGAKNKDIVTSAWTAVFGRPIQAHRLVFANRQAECDYYYARERRNVVKRAKRQQIRDRRAGLV